MEYSTHHSMGELRSHQMEMRHKAGIRDSLFSIKRDDRPMSVATEFVDMDWDEDIMSEIEDNSPRHSVNSSGGQPSITTVSSYDEAPTPRHSPSRGRDIDAEWSKSVEGPSGPHLFRNSLIANLEEEAEAGVLTMSPITPKAPRQLDEAFNLPIFHEPLPTFHEPLPMRRQSGPFKYHHGELDTSELPDWTPEMVAQSMLDAGMEQAIAERFIENDISGAILITLKFEDLKELSIQSFGIRTKVWNQIQNVCEPTPRSPRAPTPIQDEPSRELVPREEPRKISPPLSRNGTRRRQKSPSHEDLITPLESVSIVGIEQVIPEPHFCSKGEKCSTYKKRQRIIEELRRLNPDADLQSGAVVIAGDPGNPLTARALEPHETAIRPFSDAMNSVVASSDVLGPGSIPPLQYLQETTLRNLQKQDPQENVRQFLNFQQCDSNEVPPTPPFEMAPCSAPKEGLRGLPKLAIPGSRQPGYAPAVPSRLAYQSPQSRPQSQQEDDYQMEMTESPDFEPSENLYRFGTPFSEMDVPVTVVPMDRIERNISQSVPPEMSYRHNTVPTPNPPRTMSRASARRPSFPVMPALDENSATDIRTSPNSNSPQRTSIRSGRQPLHAPPRPAFPWTQNSEAASGDKPSATFHIPLISLKEAAAASNTSLNTAVGTASSAASTLQDGVTYQGPMKKRRTRMLRHEWNDGYFTLKGTRLAMHKDAMQVDRTLEYVDIDDYAIACSSLGSQSKLSAAFKRAKLLSSSSGSKDTDSVGAFAFQLIPQGKDGVAAPGKLRKRDSSFSFASGSSAAGPDGVNGTGKTHHFAVKNRDERIDWMREMMLAKAMRQKGEGFEVSVNGNQI